jgi:hypothetical protein
MTWWRDKREPGLEENAADRKDNLAPCQVRGIEVPGGPSRSPETPLPRRDRIHVLELDSHDGTNLPPAIAPIRSATREA